MSRARSLLLRSIASGLFLVEGLAPASLAQPVAGTVSPPDFSAYHVIQYAISSQFSPQSLIHADDNGALLLACRDGATREDLVAMGLEVRESQILALRMQHLLREDNDGGLQTTIPLLDPEATAALRARTARIAEQMAAALAPELRVLRERLARDGRAENSYSIVFSYVVDGLVWDLLEQRGIVERREISGDSPFWSGEVWAVNPARSETAPGTNSISDGGIKLSLSWTDDALPVEKSLLFDWKTLVEFAHSLAYRDTGLSAEARADLARYGLVDTAGSPLLPIIVEQPGQPLYEAAVALATRIADSAVPALKPQELIDRFGFRDRSQAVVIGYHELMWDLMTAWRRAGLVTPPRIFADPRHAKAADIRAVAFAVRQEDASSAEAH